MVWYGDQFAGVLAPPRAADEAPPLGRVVANLIAAGRAVELRATRRVASARGVARLKSWWSKDEQPQVRTSSDHRVR